MYKLVPIICIAMFFAIFSDVLSKYRITSSGDKVYLSKDKVFYTILALSMAVFVGLRTRGNDTYTYRQMYESMVEPGVSFSSIRWLNLASAPGLQFVCTLLHKIGASTQDYFMVFALITVIINLWFIRKYTNNIWLSVFYFITMGVYTFSMAAIKQTVAVAFLLLATDGAIQKKWIKFVVWIIIAELFHPYAFVYLIIPFLFFDPWSKWTYLLLAATVAATMMMERVFNGIFSITDALGYSNYDSTAFIGEGVNPFRVAVVWVPVFLSFIGRKYIRKNSDRVYNLMINASMINAMIMFVGLFGTANYFARLANYFLIFQVISLPWILQIFNVRTKRLVTAVSVVAFIGYSYYSNVLAQGAFDNVYAFISVSDYLKQLILR